VRPAAPLLIASFALVTFACKNAAPPGTDGGGAPAAGDLPALNPLAFLGSFEGEIDALAKDSKPGSTPTPLSVLVKTGMIRFDIPEKVAAKSGAGTMLGHDAYVIVNSTTKKLSIVSDAQKQVILVDLNTSGETFKGLGGSPPPHHGSPSAPEKTPTTVTKTGKSDTVAGYKCEIWDVASDHREGSVCVAQQGVSWFHIPMTGIPTEHLWMTELLDGQHFPLRFVGFQKDGVTEESRLEITKIDKRVLPASQFEYPPTYRVIDMMQMLTTLGALQGGMSMRPGGMAMPPHPGAMPMPPQGKMPAPAHPHPHATP
jgi:hypothetical protein